MELNEFIHQFLMDIGVRREDKIDEVDNEFNIGGFVIVFNMDSMKERIEYIQTARDSGDIYEGMLLRHDMRAHGEYSVDAFKLYCNFARLEYPDGIYIRNSLVNKAHCKILNMITNCGIK